MTSIVACARVGDVVGGGVYGGGTVGVVWWSRGGGMCECGERGGVGVVA